MNVEEGHHVHAAVARGEGQAGFDVARGGANTPQVQTRGNVLKITGILGPSRELVVPGKRFTLRQVGALGAWIEAQRKGGTSATGADRFGLSSAQLKTVHEQLQAPATFSTKGRKAVELLVLLTRRVGYPLRLSSASHRKTLTALICDQELKDLSCGTAIASRPSRKPPTAA